MQEGQNIYQSKNKNLSHQCFQKRFWTHAILHIFIMCLVIVCCACIQPSFLLSERKATFCVSHQQTHFIPVSPVTKKSNLHPSILQMRQQNLVCKQWSSRIDLQICILEAERKTRMKAGRKAGRKARRNARMKAQRKAQMTAIGRPKGRPKEIAWGGGASTPPPLFCS